MEKAMKEDSETVFVSRRIWAKTCLLFFTTLLLGGTVVGLSEAVRHERLHGEIIRLSAEQGLLIQRQINQGLSAVFAIAALVRQGNGKINDFEGVASSFAIQAGREIRVMVKPDQLDDSQAIRVAREIRKKIEEELDYPGHIKVTVIRETRVIEYAK